VHRIKAFVLGAFATAAFGGCGYSASRTVTSSAYVPPRETSTTTTYSPAYAPANSATSQVVTTVTRNSDGSVTRTSTRYYYPQAAYTYYGPDDPTLASEVRSTMQQDPLVSAHARNIGVVSDAGVVAITGKADSISAVQQASWDALQIPGVRQVDNSMRIDSTSPG
jgi:BON domain